MSEKPRIIAFRRGYADRLNAAANGAYEAISPAAGEDVLPWLDTHGAGVRLVVTIGIDRLDKGRLDRLPDLERIQVIGAGMDGIDLDEAARRGIIVENSGGLHAADSADFALTLMLGAWRGLIGADRWVRENRWVREGFPPPGRTLSNAKVGVAGLGHIGEAIARRAETFCPEVRWWGPRPKPEARWPRVESLRELAEWCDILIVAVRAHDDTRGLITREIIEAVGPQGLFVNVSRGFVVDEAALIAALKDGRLGQAALDVYEVEPTPAARWADVPNVVLAPHSAGNTSHSHGLLAEHAIGQAKAFFEC